MCVTCASIGVLRGSRSPNVTLQTHTSLCPNVCVRVRVFSVPFIIFVLLRAPAPSRVVTQIRGHKAGPSSASPLRRCMPCFLSRENSAFSFVSSSTRVEVVDHASNRILFPMFVPGMCYTGTRFTSVLDITPRRFAKLNSVSRCGC